MALTWDQMMQALAERQREPEMLRNVRLMTDIPFVLSDALELVLLSACNQVLREVPTSDQEAIGSAAVRRLSGGTVDTDEVDASYLAMPLAMVRVFGAAVDGAPAVLASPANFFQFRNMAKKYTNRYTFLSGRCYFKGTSVALTVLVEPTLTEWKGAVAPILPAGYDIRAIDVAHKRLMIADNMPQRP